MVRAKGKNSYIPDPERRAYHHALRTIRIQVMKEHEKDAAAASFLGRFFLRIRIEREIKRRMQAVSLPHRR